MNEERLFALMVDLHRDGVRQGPGSDAETRRALDLARIDRDAAITVADIGCGTGASTLLLAEELPNASITAVDLFPDFLTLLEERAAARRLDRITTLAASMDALPFEDESLDVVWSEGAVYNVGFRRGIEDWRRFLRPGGVLAVSEITWLRPDPPRELKRYWEGEYPEIATASEKISLLERAGYDLTGYAILPPECWLENYYLPTSDRLEAFLERNRGATEAEAVAEMERREADLYRRYREWYSYGFYVARKR